MRKNKKNERVLEIEKNMRKGKKNSGITLISLIITIIILLILAGISLKLIVGEKGIFNNSISAAEKYTIAAEKEKIRNSIY